MVVNNPGMEKLTRPSFLSGRMSSLEKWGWVEL